MNPRIRIIQVLKKKEIPYTENLNIGDLYEFAHMGYAEYERNTTVYSLQRISNNIDSYEIVSVNSIKDFIRNPLQMFIHKNLVEFYTKELTEYLCGNRELKAEINFRYHILGIEDTGKYMASQTTIWWDLRFDVFFTFIPDEMIKLKTSIINLIKLKKEKQEEGW